MPLFILKLKIITFSVLIKWPFLKSHNLMVLSLDAVDMILLSGENEIQLTKSLCPFNKFHKINLPICWCLIGSLGLFGGF